jgi:hypothetical protein
MGVLKATPIGQLEAKAYVFPLDLWLDGKLARFQAKLEQTGLVWRDRMCVPSECTIVRTVG